MSHIEVWKLISSDDRDYSLVLEDDVYFRFGFERLADRAWAELHTQSKSVDMFYLSFKEARTKAQRRGDSSQVFRPVRGLWHCPDTCSLGREHESSWICSRFKALSIFG